MGRFGAPIYCKPGASAPSFMFALIERLIFFLFLLSAIRSALQFILRLWRGSQSRAGMSARMSKDQPSQPRASAPGAASASTLLHQDPVCGTYVAADTSLKRIFGGKVVHFCSAECRDKYHA
jgi:YHS domain-containing protein